MITLRRLVPVWGSLLLGLGLPSTALAARTYVATPEVDWGVLLPYLRAGIVPQLSGDEFQVLICEGQTDRSVVTPFDDGLADFTRILVMQAMREAPKVFEGIGMVTERFRRRVPSLSAEERGRYREIFWEALADSPDVLPEIRALFVSARSRGRLRCWPCDRDASFAPHAQRIQRGR